VPAKKGTQPLSVTHPELAKEAVDWDPGLFTAGSDRKMVWRCAKGHNYISPIGQRVRRGNSCVFCSGHQVLTGFNDFASTHKSSYLLDEVDGWDPKTISAGSGKKVKWKCSRGHIAEATISARLRGKGCPICLNRQILIGFNDLATTDPLLAAEAYEWDPKSLTRGSEKKVKWKCSVNHIWETSPNNRTNQKSNKPYAECAVCMNRQLLSGFNDLSTTHPEVAKEAYGWDPSEVFAGLNQKRKWKCSRGHIFETLVNSRTTKDRNVGCMFCTNQKVLKGFNDLATTHPELAKQAYGWDPSTVFAGTIKKYDWKCEEGHIYSAQPNNRSYMQSGCQECAKFGFHSNLDGWIYLLRHSNWKMFQIGITNVPDKRLQTHKKLGWELIELRGPMDGHLAQQWETAILRMLKAKGADLSNAEIAGKFDGFSEAWSKSTFEANSIKELMRFTEEFEGN
jgi:hypothetical protein